jgi:hypothetical protein
MASKGAYYRIETAINDPRQKEVWWREVAVTKYRADAIAEANRQNRQGDQPIRIVFVSEECVWLNKSAKIALGQSVE